jgi:hypothetical protein
MNVSYASFFKLRNARRTEKNYENNLSQDNWSPDRYLKTESFEYESTIDFKRGVRFY